MFVRKTGPYYRVVESYREGDKVRHRTLLSLGKSPTLSTYRDLLTQEIRAAEGLLLELRTAAQRQAAARLEELRKKRRLATTLMRDLEPDALNSESIGVHFSSASAEWPTPEVAFNALNEEFGFTLDPCATDENHKCAKYYTEEDDGLHQSWAPETVFMNPPYGRGIDRWVRKAYMESLRGATVVCLLPARTDTAWWHDYCMRGEIRFIRGRLKFADHDNSAPFPSAVVLFSEVPQ
jgi:site-specific DNA-methyltransferase (adenine-specific)